MGNGCLKPTPRNGQIYIDCINKIYEQVKQFQNFESKNDSDMYTFIKEKIQKKGWLRKLMDNLTSHRQSISEAALHNFRLMAQSKGTQYKVAGLVVIDFIINSVLRQSGLDMSEKTAGIPMKMIMKQKDINAESEYEESQFRRQSLPPVNVKSRNQVLYTASSIHNFQNLEQSNPANIRQTYSLNNVSKITTNEKQNPSQTNSLMLREIYNVKFSNIFYNMIHSILSTEDGIYSSGVKSIIMYTRYHSVKNIQQEKIIDLLQILLEHVQTGERVNISLKAYEMLVQKLRDSFLENQINHFKVFLKIWEESFRHLNDEENPHFQINAENRYLLESIIHKMISEMIGSMSVNKIYEQIILVYDQHKFENMVHFQEMLISITRKDELKSQFFRGLYSFLLSYLAVCRGNGLGQSMKSISSVKQINSPSLISQKWPVIHSSKSYEAFINEYQNILDLNIKKSVIQTLKRWIKSYDFIQINEIIKYNSSLFLNSFLFNIHECFLSEMQQSNQNSSMSSRGLVKYLSDEFQDFCKTAEIQQRISLVNQLYDQVKLQNIEEPQKLMYLQMINNLLFEEWIEGTKIIELCQVDTDYSQTVNIQLISQTGIFISKFTQKMLSQQIDQISYFLYSIFDLLSRISLPYQQLLILLAASIKLIQTIQRAQGSLIILALTQRMVKAVCNEMDKTNFFVCWDLILNCSFILLSSPRNNNRQNSKKELNEIYIKTTLNEQLKASVNKISEADFDEKVQKIIIDVFGDMDQQDQQQGLIKIKLPQMEDFQNHSNLTGSHQKLYELASIAFRDMFSRGVSKVKGGFFPAHEEQVSFISQNGGFSRANSIIREEDIHHEERSIADVMDMIHL